MSTGYDLAIYSKTPFHFCNQISGQCVCKGFVLNPKHMPVHILTTEDLWEFKTELLGEIKELLNENQAKVIKKEWLKSTQVMNMLSISSGTLRSLRRSGILSFTKIGGLIFYDAEQIQTILMDNLVKNSKQKK